MRWLSPPERELLRRFSVRYPNPTSIRKRIRLLISNKMRRATFVSCSFSFSSSKNFFNSVIGRSTSSDIFFPPTRTYPASGFNRVPWHLGQSVLPLYRANITRYCILYWFSSNILKKALIPSKYFVPSHSIQRCSSVSS